MGFFLFFTNIYIFDIELFNIFYLGFFSETFVC